MISPHVQVGEACGPGPEVAGLAGVEYEQVSESDFTGSAVVLMVSV